MAIVSSTFIKGHEQADGRSYVIEHHTDSVGMVHVIEYLAPVGTNYQAVADARAVVIAEQLAQQEFEAMTNG